MGSRAVAPPLFVLAPARSYSSVVCAMLGQHPRLYGFPELRLFRADDVAGLLREPAPGRGPPACERTAGLVRALAQLHEGSQSGEAAERAFEWLRGRSEWSVGSLLEYLLESVAPRIGVEKSPETSRSDAAMRRMLRACPEARFIHLVRHPYSTVASMRAAWSGLRYWDVPAEREAAHCLAVWCEQHRRIAALADVLPAERYLRVRAEEVLDAPAVMLPVVCRWLGIEDAPEAVERMMSPERSPYASPGPQNARGGLDPSFLERPRLRPPRRSVPELLPAKDDDKELWRAATVLARQFGYKEDPNPAQVFRIPRGTRRT